jgi:hypothetical protein
VFADVGYFEAWSQWLDHENLAAETLWGVEIFWWGRIGKILQLVGGLTVVAEWIGKERMKQASDLLRKGHIAAVGAKAWQAGKNALVGYLRVLRGAEGTGPQLAAQLVTAAISLLTVLAVLIPGFGPTARTLTTYILVALTLPLVASILLMTAALLGRGLDLVLVRPLSKLLDKGDLVSWTVQVGGVLLLVAGIHFDLLAG